MTSSARKKPARQQAPRAAVPIRSSSNGTRILARVKASPNADPYISGTFLLLVLKYSHIDATDASFFYLIFSSDWKVGTQEA